MRILVVEDHCDTRTVLATLLSRCGCQTVIAKNMKDARSQLAAMSFDALVSDLNLPDGDGLDLVAEAKRLHGLSAIAVTGRTEVVERERGLWAGCDFYLTITGGLTVNSTGNLLFAAGSTVTTGANSSNAGCKTSRL